MNNTSTASSDPYMSINSGATFPKIFSDAQDGSTDGRNSATQPQQQHDANGTSYPQPMYHNASQQQQQQQHGSSAPTSTHTPYSSSTPSGYSGYNSGMSSMQPPASGWSSSAGTHQVHSSSGGSGQATGAYTSGSIPLPHQPGGSYPSSMTNSSAGGAYPGGAAALSSSSGVNLPLPQLSVSSGMPSVPPGGMPASYPYPAMGGLQMQPPGHQPPLSAPGVLGASVIQGGLGPYGQNSVAAGPQAADMAARALAAVQANTNGGVPSSGLSAQGLASVVTRPQLGDDLYCSCPMVCVVGTNYGAPHAVPLSIMSLQFEVSCHISQAFVHMQLVCHYPMNWNDAPLVLFLPKSTDTTITELCIENMVRPSVFATAVVPLEDMKKYSGGKGGVAPVTAGSDPEDTAGTDPEMFMLPLPPGLPGDQYRVRLSYFHAMVFDVLQGKYLLRLPTTVPAVCLAQGSSVNSVLDVRVGVNTGTSDDVELLVPSHPVVIQSKQPGSVNFELDTSQVWENGDFVAGYSVWTRDQVTATVHVEAPQPGMPDQRGTFALSITPPGPEKCVRFPRSVVFMFDRSGSMTGDPIRFAKVALLNGLHMLGPEDRFTVVAFDHEQLWWTDRLIEATPENILTCMHWVNDDLSARGTTDIHAPLQRALKLLAGASGLPLVFLLTDGCVDDERDICIMAENSIKAATAVDVSNIVITTDGSTMTVNPAPPTPSPPMLAPRVYTFGIGPYCNHYFLKRLAAIGRGMNDVAFRPHAIQAVMERMLAAAAMPMLSDVQIRVQGLTQVELYPFPIPDVFVGQPLLVSGKFEGDWPESVEICGTLPDGNSWSQIVPTMPAGDLPLHKVFVKSQLDLMTANAWMAGNPPNLVQQIVDLSMASGVASAHTAMVGFETTPQRYEQMQAVPPNERRKKIIKWAIGGAAGIGIVAGVAAALTFGDLASTMANMPVGDAMAGIGGDLGTFFEGLGGAMDCCGGNCDCCGDCGDACNVCVTC
ncbi:hypothetical protein OEZ86_013065 [Tetradesmus obliquus]|nr:hypothetical protein OEZ86_013065 [Tetradesmus obliquus]